MRVIDPNEQLLTIKQAAELLGISPVTLKRHIAAGRLPSIKLGRSRRLPGNIVGQLQTGKLEGTRLKPQDLLKIIPGFMGGKTAVLEFIRSEIAAITKPGDAILDIFSGSGIVGYALKDSYKIYSNDVEPFAHAIATLLVENKLSSTQLKQFDPSPFLNAYQKNLSALTKENADALSSEERFLARKVKTSPPEIFSAARVNPYQGNHQRFPYRLFSEYFSNTYFGLRQAMEIDSLRYAIDQVNPRHSPLLLGCLIFSCYKNVSSVGSHFAQPKRPKLKNISSIVSRRRSSVLGAFMAKLSEVQQELIITARENRAFSVDFRELFSNNKYRKQLEDVRVVYIDPPYTIDHYSRFYHILNTLVLYDYPTREGIGLYRNDRRQSGFSIRSKALAELDCLIGNIASLGSAVVLSYSDSYRSLLKIDEILTVLKRHYQADTIKTPIKIAHLYSGFGQSANNKGNELIFVATKSLR